MALESDAILHLLRSGPLLLFYYIPEVTKGDPDEPMLEDAIDPELMPTVTIGSAWYSEADQTTELGETYFHEACDGELKVGATRLKRVSLLLHLDGAGDKLVTLSGHLGTYNQCYRDVHRQIPKDEFSNRLGSAKDMVNFIDRLVGLCIQASNPADLGQVNDLPTSIVVHGPDTSNREDSEDDVDTVIMLRPGPFKRLAGAVTGTIDRMANWYWQWSQQNYNLEEDSELDERKAA